MISGVGAQMLSPVDSSVNNHVLHLCGAVSLSRLNTAANSFLLLLLSQVLLNRFLKKH